MVGRILETLRKPVRGLHEAAYVLAGLTLASQVLALLRDRLFAHQFGASELLDMYYAAFKVPDLVFALVASLVSAYVLIPRIAAAEKREARRIISETVTFLAIAGGVICAALALATPQIMFHLFPAFESSPNADAFILLTRLLLIQPILLGLSSIVMSVTQVERRFLVFSLSPVLYNLGIIAGVVFLYPIWGLPGIGIGVVLGAMLHVGIQLPTLIEAGLFPRMVIPSVSRLLDIMKDSIPRSLALGMGSIVTLFLTALAVRTGAGGASILTLASNLEAVPLALIGASYATAAFPALAEYAGKKQAEEFEATLKAAARHLIFWSAVILVLTIVLRAHIVRALLGTGAFDWDATRLTAATLAILVMGLIAQGITLLSSRAFYAAQRSWTPFVIQLFGATVSYSGAVYLLHLSATAPEFRYFIEALFRVSDIPGTDILLIALGATVGQILMGGIALLSLRSVAPGTPSSLIRPLCEGLAAAILGGVAAYGVLVLGGSIAPLTTLVAVFAEALAAGIVGLAVSAGVLILLENKEFRDLYAALRRIKDRVLPPLSEF